MTERPYHHDSTEMLEGILKDPIIGEPAKRRVREELALRAKTACPDDGVPKDSRRSLGNPLIHMTLPLPPTANTYWRNVKGRTLLSKGGRAYREAAHLAGLAHRVEPIEGGVEMTARIYMKRLGCDLDNRAKPLLDALHGVLYEDDVQVEGLLLIKDLDRENPRVELTAWPTKHGGGWRQIRGEEAS